MSKDLFFDLRARELEVSFEEITPSEFPSDFWNHRVNPVTGFSTDDRIVVLNKNINV